MFANFSFDLIPDKYKVIMVSILRSLSDEPIYSIWVWQVLHATLYVYTMDKIEL